MGFKEKVTKVVRRADVSVEEVPNSTLVFLSQHLQIGLQGLPDRDDLFNVAVEIGAVVGSVCDDDRRMSGRHRTFDKLPLSVSGQLGPFFRGVYLASPAPVWSGDQSSGFDWFALGK